MTEHTAPVPAGSRADGTGPDGEDAGTVPTAPAAVPSSADGTPPSDPWPPPAPDPSTAPDTTPVPGPDRASRPGPLRRLRQLHARQGAGNRIAFYALVLAALACLSPMATDLYRKVCPESALAFVVEPGNNICTGSWLISPDNDRLRDVLAASDVRQIGRWEKESRITHADADLATVTLSGNADKAVVIRGISITVLSRSQPLPGVFAQGGGCGGADVPEYLVVDLDKLPLKRAVPVSCLRDSPNQKDARAAASRMGKLISLPKQVTTDDSHSFFLTGRAQRTSCTWIATITWWDGDQEHESRLDSDGRPFRVTATHH